MATPYNLRTALHLLFKAFLFSVLIAVYSHSVPAQSNQINAASRGETIDSIIKLLKEKYAYPEIASKMETELRMRQKRGDYDSLTDGDRFAEKVTADLRGVFDDKHLRLSYSAQPIAAQSSKAGAPSAEEIEQARLRQKRENFGAVKVEILKGNVGLIQLNYFAPLDWVSDTYTAAMNYVANTDALIIDARTNGGSMDINTIPFFCSYLFEQPVQIGDILLRETNETRQLWTYAQVPGKRYLNKPVFILTSGRTASGAEAFVSSMRRLKRATLVGEPTKGATMPGGSHRVNDHFSIWISTGRSSSGSVQNENKGTQPDIAVPAADALTEAYRQALDRIEQTSQDAEWKAELGKIRAGLTIK